MILDKELVFSDAQDETTVAAHASDNIIDLTTAGDALDSLWLVVAVQTTVTSDGNATVTFALQTDSDSAFGTAETLLATAAIGKASLTAGTQVIRARIPMGCKRHLRVLYTIGTAVLTAGKFDAYLVSGIDKLS
jgi:hypothetical protein